MSQELVRRLWTVWDREERLRKESIEWRKSGECGD